MKKPVISASPSPGPANPHHRWQVLGFLFTVYVVNVIDRTILGILAEPIKKEFGLSDTAFGLLGGLAFAAFYAVMGIPLARLADRWIRRHLLLMCLVAWSVMCMVCGLAQSYAQLLFARIGVAIGEAGATPASHSMISDLFAPGERATALAIFSVATTVGTVGGLMLGAYVNEIYGWRMAFIAAGAPGLLLAAVGHFWLKEPVRGASDAPSSAAVSIGSLPASQVIKHLMVEQKTYRYLAFATAMHAFAGAGISLWLPAFLMRSHDMKSTEIAAVLGVVGVSATAVGILAGGVLTDRMARKWGQRWYLWLPAIGNIVAVPLTILAFAYPEPRVALAIYLIPAALGYLYLGPAFALAQNLVPQNMRAMASTIILFLAVLIGQGGGPLFVGWVSDWLSQRAGIGGDSLRYALMAGQLFNVVSAILYFRAARYLGDAGAHGLAREPEREAATQRSGEQSAAEP